MFDYRYAAAFIAVAKTSSITKAAEDLNVAQSAVSRQISLLEDAMGIQLFFRGTRGVQLTPLGKNLFQKIQETDHWIRNDFAGQSIPIRIGGLEGTLNVWLANKLIQSSTADLPKNLILKPLSNEEIVAGLERNEIDIGLSSKKIESEWIHSKKLYTEKIYIISKDEIDMEKIENYVWIGVNQCSYLFKLARGKHPSRQVYAGSVDLLIKLVKAGQGIAAVTDKLIPERGVNSYATSLVNESIYLNRSNYKKVPRQLSDFIRRFIDPRFPSTL